MQRAAIRAEAPAHRGQVATLLLVVGTLAGLAMSMANAQAQRPTLLPPPLPSPLPPPLPPARPPEMREPPAPSAAPAPPSHGASPGAAGPKRAPEDPASCLAKLGASGVKAETVSAPPASLQDCGIAAPVRLSSITLASGTSLDLVDRPILDCEFAGVFADYVMNAMAPLAQSMLGSPMVALATGPGYECRGRNQVAGAKTSAHGKGIAIDLAAVTLADRRRIEVAQQAQMSETLFLRAMRKAACGWFTTVLGPGSDAAHANHLHFDILRHGASENYRICE
jgi:hypothetical protein